MCKAALEHRLTPGSLFDVQRDVEGPCSICRGLAGMQYTFGIGHPEIQSLIQK